MIHPRPPATGLTTAEWLKLPVWIIPIDAVVPTQHVDATFLGGHCCTQCQPSPVASGDPFGHVVVVDGRWLIEDGHHRWARARAKGDPVWQARVYVLPECRPGQCELFGVTIQS